MKSIVNFTGTFKIWIFLARLDSINSGFRLFTIIDIS